MKSPARHDDENAWDGGWKVGTSREDEIAVALLPVETSVKEAAVPLSRRDYSVDSTAFHRAYNATAV